MNFYKNRMSKFNAKKTVVNGIRFDSKREALRYTHLLLKQRAGEISDLELQPVFVLQDKFTYNNVVYRAINYVADFMYKASGCIYVEDVKGFKTPEYLLKREIFLKQYGQLYKFLEI